MLNCTDGRALHNPESVAGNPERAKQLVELRRREWAAQQADLRADFLEGLLPHGLTNRRVGRGAHGSEDGRPPPLGIGEQPLQVTLCRLVVFGGNTRGLELSEQLKASDRIPHAAEHIRRNESRREPYDAISESAAIDFRISCPACLTPRPARAINMLIRGVWNNVSCKHCLINRRSNTWLCPCGLAWHTCANHASTGFSCGRPIFYGPQNPPAKQADYGPLGSPPLSGSL